MLRESANNLGMKVCELIFRAAEAAWLSYALERLTHIERSDIFTFFS